MKKNKLCSVIIILAFVFAGIGTASAETLELLTWKGYAPKPLVEKFEKETGIKSYRQYQMVSAGSGQT